MLSAGCNDTRLLRSLAKATANRVGMKRGGDESGDRKVFRVFGYCGERGDLCGELGTVKQIF